MEYKFIDRDKGTSTIQIIVDGVEFDNLKKKNLRDLRKNLSIDGFRKGRVPFAIIEQLYGKENLEKEAIEDIIDKNFEKAAKELDLTTFTLPYITDYQIDDNGNLVVTIEFGSSPEVDIEKAAEYKPDNMDEILTELSDDDFNKAVEDILIDFSDITPKDSATQKGDYVDLEVVETKGNTKSPYLYSLILGEDDDLFTQKDQENLLGQTVNDVVEFTGENGNEFKVTVDLVGDITKAELTDEFVNKAFGFKDVDEFKDFYEPIAINNHGFYTEKELGKEIYDNYLKNAVVTFSPYFEREAKEILEHSNGNGAIEVLSTLYPYYDPELSDLENYLKFYNEVGLLDYLQAINEINILKKEYNDYRELKFLNNAIYKDLEKTNSYYLDLIDYYDFLRDKVYVELANDLILDQIKEDQE